MSLIDPQLPVTNGSSPEGQTPFVAYSTTQADSIRPSRHRKQHFPQLRCDDIDSGKSRPLRQTSMPRDSRAMSPIKDNASGAGECHARCMRQKKVLARREMRLSAFDFRSCPRVFRFMLSAQMASSAILATFCNNRTNESLEKTSLAVFNIT